MGVLPRRATVAIAPILTLLASFVVSVAPAAAQSEGCPSPTSSLVAFSWSGTSFVPDGGDSKGVTVSGDASTAWWSSTETISALVLTADGLSYNIALDMPETVGTISPDNYSVFGGADLESLRFCTGDKTRPDTTTRGPSVELSKTAECATIGDDGQATVKGTITADLDSPMAARITSALDSIVIGGNTVIHQEAIPGLIGVVLTPEADEVTVAYEITFDPGDATNFENFVEVTLEDATTGEDRHKVYNARAAFTSCEEPSTEPSAEPSEEPSTEPSEEPSTEPSTEPSEEPSPSETGGIEGGNPTPTPGDLPDTAVGQVGQLPATVLSLILLAALAAMVTVRLARQR